jgi:phospholipid transport system substrate-binding protein
MARRLFNLIRSLLLLSSLTLVLPAFAADGPGVTAVKRANEKVRALLEQKPEPGSPAEKKLAAELSTQLAGFLDIDELGQRALNQHWKTLAPAQRKEFLSLLRELVEGNYIRAMRSNLTYQVKYLEEKEQDASRVVSTELELQRNGRPETMSVDYALRKEGNDWRAFDLITDGVGLVENYRAQFNKIIAKEGMAGLLERMRKKTATQNGGQ